MRTTATIWALLGLLACTVDRGGLTPTCTPACGADETCASGVCRPSLDAGIDAGGLDASFDAPFDAALDGGVDSGVDAGVDAGPDDTGVDAGTPWDPTRIPGVRAWFRADLGVEGSGGFVDTWRNQVGATGDCTATAAARPRVVGSGFGSSSAPYVESDGVDDVLVCRDLDLGAPPGSLLGYSMVIVFDELSRADNAIITGVGYFTSPAPRLRQKTTSFAQLVNAPLNVVSSAGDDDRPHWVVGEADGASQRLFVDGALVDSDPTTAVLNAVPNPTNLTVFGAAGSGYARLRVAELIVSTSPISASDRDELSTYFATRYGL